MVNKKYNFLDDHQELLNNLKNKSVKEYAEELAQRTGVDYQTLHACITFRKNRYFSAEEKKMVKRDRKPKKRKLDY